MGLKPGQANLTATVSVETHRRLHAIAADRGMSASHMVAEWLESGAGEPLELAGKVQAVRKAKDELMVSLPWRFLRSTGLVKGSRIRVAYGRNSLILTPKKVSK